MHSHNKHKLRTLAELCHEVDTEEASKSLFLIVNDGINYNVQCMLAHKREGNIRCHYLETKKNGNISYLCESPKYQKFAAEKIEELKEESKVHFIPLIEQIYSSNLAN